VLLERSFGVRMAPPSLTAPATVPSARASRSGVMDALLRQSRGAAPTRRAAASPLQRSLSGSGARAQVITAVLAFLTRGMPPLALNAPTKTPADYWSAGGAVELRWRGSNEAFAFPKSADGELTVLSGELLTGVADKAVYAKFGLVHAVQARRGPRALPGRAGSAVCPGLKCVRVFASTELLVYALRKARHSSDVSHLIVVRHACASGILPSHCEQDGASSIELS